MRHEQVPVGNDGGVPVSAVRAQLTRILQSPGFARAPRLRRFLFYAVDEALAGRVEKLREYTLGVDVFDRGEGFDPTLDPIVRVDARRLRKVIARYYLGDGAGDPVEIGLPTGSYLPVFRLRGGAGRPKDRPKVRLAVARFAAAAGDEAMLGFAEGLTDELLLALDGRAEFQVIAGQRSAGDGADLATLASQLGANMVLSGKVRREGETVRVRATLSTADGAQVWADRYDARLDDLGEVLGLQDELAKRIAGLVAPRLKGAWRERKRPSTRDAEAYELYLRGRHQLNATRPGGLLASIALLEAAVARDGEFAEAHAALAEARLLLWLFQMAPPAEALNAARTHAEAALSIDPELPAAHAALGRVSVALDNNLAAAGAALDRALSLDPLSAEIRNARASWLLTPQGRLDEALAELGSLLDHAPYSLRLRYEYARVLYFQRRFEEAIRQLELVLEFDAEFPGAVFALAFAYEHTGKLDQARAAHAQHIRLLPVPLSTLWFRAACAVWDGQVDQARAILAEMEATARGAPMAASVMADAWLRLGENGRAIDWLERAADQRLYRSIYLAVDPDYAPLRGEGRFAALLARLHLV